MRKKTQSQRFIDSPRCGDVERIDGQLFFFDADEVLYEHGRDPKILSWKVWTLQKDAYACLGTMLGAD